MDVFEFVTPLANLPFEIRQDAAKDIGFKLYPGALVLAKFLEDLTITDSWKDYCREGAVVLELGAGICGLGGTLAALAGYPAVCTDLPTVLPMLQSNIEANAAIVAGKASVMSLPLPWGSEIDVDSMLSTLKERSVGLILGADVVYHEHLIDPLLKTLVLLTEPGSAAAVAPPVVLLSYVQRFKRSRAFFKKANKWFDVEVKSCGDVVDYDCLTWTLPRIDKLIDARGPSCIWKVDSSSASFERFVEAASRLSSLAPPPAAAEGSACKRIDHAVDSDSDSEKTFSDLLGMVRADEIFTNYAEGEVATGAGRSWQASCINFGLPVADPLHAYIYVLRRRVV